MVSRKKILAGLAATLPGIVNTPGTMSDPIPEYKSLQGHANLPQVGNTQQYSPNPAANPLMEPVSKVDPNMRPTTPKGGDERTGRGGNGRRDRSTSRPRGNQEQQQQGGGGGGGGGGFGTTAQTLTAVASVAGLAGVASTAYGAGYSNGVNKSTTAAAEKKAAKGGESNKKRKLAASVRDATSSEDEADFKFNFQPVVKK